MLSWIASMLNRNESPALWAVSRYHRNGVGAVAVENRPRARSRCPSILLIFWPVGVEDEPEAHHVAVGRLVEQQRRLGSSE